MLDKLGKQIDIDIITTTSIHDLYNNTTAKHKFIIDIWGKKWDEYHDLITTISLTIKNNIEKIKY
jgi:hypothetical protein